MTQAPDWDVILAGGGLASGLIAYRLRQRRPAWRVLVLESRRVIGGNHTWSMHQRDLSAEQRAWVEPFLSHRWPHYHVRFPDLDRQVGLGYASVTSDGFADVLRKAGVATRTNVQVEAVSPNEVRLADGSVLRAAAVVDGRGYRADPHLRLAYQKFFGRELRLATPHGLLAPVIMDATVEQHDGYRFVYLLPFEADRILVEDTYYADGPTLDRDILRQRVDAYVAEQGWAVLRVLREEDGVLPITLSGDIDGFWNAAPGQPRAGLRAGLFHPTTGYSFAEAVRLADRIADLPTPDAAGMAAAIEHQARRRWRRQRLFRALNRMLFLAGRPDERWSVMQRFYRLPEPLISRFYAGDLSHFDALRLLSGKPPVPVGPALRAVMDHAL